MNLIESKTPFSLNNALSLSNPCFIFDVFKISLELLIFFKIFDQTEITFGLILSKLLKEPKVKNLFFRKLGGFSILSISNPQ